jgi:hypothetical protein
MSDELTTLALAHDQQAKREAESHDELMAAGEGVLASLLKPDPLDLRRRFWLLSWIDYGQSGGLDDITATFHTFDEALVAARARGLVTCVQIADRVTGELREGRVAQSRVSGRFYILGIDTDYHDDEAAERALGPVQP